mgnify:CR=1 FL=1
MLRIALGLGVVAIGFWIWRRQSVRKGLGFTFHGWMFGDFGAWALIALIAMAGIFVVEWVTGGIQVVGFSLDLNSMGRDAGWFIFGAFFEEFIFRSLILRGLVALFLGRKWPAIIISAALFGYAHLNNPNASYITAFGNALGGLMYGIAFLGGKNIWLPVGLHFGWNFFQGPIFGFPVSGLTYQSLIGQETTGSDLLTGGAYGPEAGLVGMTFRFVVIALLLYYLHRRCSRQGEIKSLTFPIKVYDNSPRLDRKTTLQESF